MLLDALAFGVPIAATRAGGIPEVIVDGDSGLLAERGKSRGARRRDRVASSSTRSSARGCAPTPRRARAEFSVERMTDRTISVYESVAR